MKAVMKWISVIAISRWRLLSTGEVRSLAETKKKNSPRTQAAIMVASRYVRETAWVKRKILQSCYSMYSEEEWSRYSELMGVVKAFILPSWDPMLFWQVFLVSVTSVCNSMRSEATQGTKRTARGEPKAKPAVFFVT